MSKSNLLLFLRVALRGIVLTVGLVWFAHINLSPEPPPEEVVHKPGLVESLAKKVNTSESKVRAILLELGPALAKELENGKLIHLPGLGYFHREEVPGALERDPRTLQYNYKPSIQSIRFVPNQELMQNINKESSKKVASNQTY